MYDNLEKFLNKDPIREGLENFNIEIYNSRTIDQIPLDQKGLYSWHFYPRKLDINGLLDCSSIYFNKKFDAEIKSKLNEKYSGPITFSTEDSIELKNKKIHQDPLFFKFLQFAAVNLSPPIYIGRSNQLDIRLKTHRDQLQEHISSHNRDTYDNSHKYDKDSDEESTHFGIRVAKLINEETSSDLKIGIQNFFVRTITLTDNFPDSLSESYMNEVERILLHLYKPIFSIK